LSRRLKIRTNELGFLELFLIYVYGEAWEDEWFQLQGQPITANIPQVSKATMDHALRGWTRPFLDQLGPAPALLLRKLPETHSQCVQRKRCSLYIPHYCVPSAKKMPWCFQPEGTDDFTGPLAAEIIRLWREGVYIVLVQEA
jgi:hypothetical protein